VLNLVPYPGLFSTVTFGRIGCCLRGGRAGIPKHSAEQGPRGFPRLDRQLLLPLLLQICPFFLFRN
jgi:hypothetical protein